MEEKTCELCQEVFEPVDKVHIHQRFCSSNCRDKSKRIRKKSQIKEINKRYYLRNKDKINKRAKEYRERNKDKVKQRAKIFREKNKKLCYERQKRSIKKNKEHYLKKRRERKHNNPEKTYFEGLRERARKYGIQHRFSDEDWLNKLEGKIYDLESGFKTIPPWS